MIKNLFIPDQIKGYYVLGTRIIGIDLGKSAVKATVLFCKGKEITIEKCLEHPIATTLEYQEAATTALKVILDQVGSYDMLVAALSSSYAVFKELKLPFMGLDTLRKVIGYEVEPLLPFSLQDAVIDCIITKEIPEEKSSEVLIAAVQNQYMAQHLSIFEAAGVQPEKVTLDLFALYGLYRLIPTYADFQGGVVLLEIEPLSTRMAYIYHGQLRFIRTLPKGLLEQARMVAAHLHMSEQEALEQMIRFGLEADPTYTAALKQTFGIFFNDILFTLQSFVSTAKPTQSISKIIVFGTSATIKGLPSLIADLSHIKTEVFALNSLIHNGFGINAKSAIPQTALVSLAAALPLSTTVRFDLRQKEFTFSQSQFFTHQILTAGLLICLIIGSLLGTTIWQTIKLKRELYQSEQEVIETIKEHIKKIPDDATTVDDVIEAATRIVSQEERIWSAFSSTARLHILEYLLELSTKINKAALGMDIEKLTITPETIIIKGKVRGWEELKTLESDLKSSKIFKAQSVPDPNFLTNGMVIYIKKSGHRGRP